MPNELKHTPGPWVAGPLNPPLIPGAWEVRSQTGSSAGEPLCLHLLPQIQVVTPQPHVEADARLISAAPDLLELAQWADANLQAYISADVYDGHVAKWFRDLAELLKKAEGRE